MNSRQAIVLIGLVAGCVATNACDADATSDYNDGCVNPKRVDYEQPYCIEFRRPDACMVPARGMYDENLCVIYRKDRALIINGYMGGVPDAGESDGGADASSVRMGRCGPDAPDGYEDPEPVWFGPIDEAPAGCQSKMGSFGDRNYYELYKPTLDGCALCGCEPIKGMCSLAAETIHFRDVMCGEDANLVTKFGPLENWDGSCASDHTIAANAECPLGSGIPCVQSFYASALPEPNQGCKTVEIPVANAITDVPKWENLALSCRSTPVAPSAKLRELFPNDKADHYNTCVPGGEGWRTCVKPPMGSTDCEQESMFRVKKVVYEKSGYIDSRHCSACGCEASGGACIGTLNVYEDGECKNVLATELLDSNGPACDDLLPPGKAIGSKDLTSLDYVPGSCKATGGTPQGGVVEDEAKAIVWCCLTEESALYNIDLE